MSTFANPYFETTDYHYKVKYTNAEGLESIELHSVDNRRAGIEDSIQWVYKEYKTTHFVPKYCVQDSNTVLLSSPTRGVFAETENIPNPQVKFPLNVGDSIYVEQPTSNGDIMRGYLKVTGKVQHGKASQEVDKWVVEAYNLDNMEYSAIYYYSKKDGFVYMNYKLDDKEIEMDYTISSHHMFAD